MEDNSAKRTAVRWGYGLVTKGWSNALPRRPRSAWKAAQTLRKHALHRASTFVEGLAALEAALQVVQRTLAAGLTNARRIRGRFNCCSL